MLLLLFLWVIKEFTLTFSFHWKSQSESSSAAPSWNVQIVRGIKKKEAGVLKHTAALWRTCISHVWLYIIQHAHLTLSFSLLGSKKKNAFHMFCFHRSNDANVSFTCPDTRSSEASRLDSTSQRSEMLLESIINLLLHQQINQREIWLFRH